MIYYQKIIVNNESEALWGLKKLRWKTNWQHKCLTEKNPFNVPSGKARNGSVLGLTQNTLIFIGRHIKL